MATQTLNPETTKARRTTVAMKLIMATTGALFVLFVLAHMYGNLKAFAGQATYDEYAHHLRTFATPILPYKGFLWVFRAVLIVAVVGHVYAALYLWKRASGARTTRYAVKVAGRAALRSQMMRWGGVALILFIIFHLIEFTTNKVNFNSSVSNSSIGDSPYRLLVADFKPWWLVVIYMVALCALAVHLQHGIWSAAQTLGMTTSPRARLAAKMTANIVSLVVLVGFAIVPLSIAVGIIK